MSAFLVSVEIGKRENAQLARSVIFRFGRCSQRAGAEIGAGPIPDMLANLQNLYVQALLAMYQTIQVCIACHVVNMDGTALLARY